MDKSDGSGFDWRDVIKGRPAPQGVWLHPVVWSSDGTRYAYRAFVEATGNYILVVDGEKLGEYKHVSEPVWSPDSKRYAVAVLTNRWKLVVNGVYVGVHSEVIGDIAWSPDSERVAYVIESNPLSVAVDGRTLRNLSYAGDLRFEPDGSVVFIASFCTPKNE